MAVTLRTAVYAAHESDRINGGACIGFAQVSTGPEWGRVGYG